MVDEVKEPIREAVGGREEDLEDSLNSEGPVLVVEGTDEAVDDGEKCHSESTDSVVDDHDKKCCSWSLDTDENPNNCGKSHIVGKQNDESEECRIESLEKESDVENGERGHQVFMDHSKTDQGGKSHLEMLEEIEPTGEEETESNEDEDQDEV